MAFFCPLHVLPNVGPAHTHIRFPSSFKREEKEEEEYSFVNLSRGQKNQNRSEAGGRNGQKNREIGFLLLTLIFPLNWYCSPTRSDWKKICIFTGSWLRKVQFSRCYARSHAPPPAAVLVSSYPYLWEVAREPWPKLANTGGMGEDGDSPNMKRTGQNCRQCQTGAMLASNLVCIKFEFGKSHTVSFSGERKKRWRRFREKKFRGFSSYVRPTDDLFLTKKKITRK